MDKMEYSKDDVQLVPLISSSNTINSLINKKIDFAVVATKNSTAGAVSETYEAVKDKQIELVDTEILDIHHCMFVKENTKIDELKYIASHPQALLQTKKFREQNYPDLIEVEKEDTAICAEYLSEGAISSNTAIICRKEAGIDNGLKLIEENIEDSNTNKTEFRIYKFPSIDYDNSEYASLHDRFMYSLITQKGIGVIGKTFIILGIFALLVVSGSSFLNSIEIAACLGGLVSAVFLYLTSNNVRQNIQYKNLTGYWKYYSIADKENVQGDLMYEIPRIVEISVLDDELYIRGWICDRADTPFFEAERVMVSSSDKLKGSLVYWYQKPREVNRDYNVGGIVELNWVKKHHAASINKMSGRYSGALTKETGCITYYRITKQEFDVHRKCEFLGTDC